MRSLSFISMFALLLTAPARSGEPDGRKETRGGVIFEHVTTASMSVKETDEGLVIETRNVAYSKEYVEHGGKRVHVLARKMSSRFND